MYLETITVVLVDDEDGSRLATKETRFIPQEDDYIHLMEGVYIVTHREFHWPPEGMDFCEVHVTAMEDL